MIDAPSLGVTRPVAVILSVKLVALAVEFIAGPESLKMAHFYGFPPRVCVHALR